MANELNIALPTSGLSVTAQLYQGGAASGSAISLSEVGSSGFYSGNMTGSAGTYQVAFIAASTNVGSGSIVWDGTAEVPVSTLTAAQVNAECDTAISDVGLTTTVTGRIDAAVSTRATPAQVNSECDTALSDVGLTTTVTGRIDAAISTRATPADVPSEAAIATEVWDTQTSALTTSGAIGTRLKNSSTVATTGAQLAAALS